MSRPFGPAEWICGILSIRASTSVPSEPPMKLIGISKLEDGSTHLRVLHRETGAVWQLICSIEDPK